MTEQDLKNTKNRVIEEFTREHLYNPLWFNDFFQANIDLDKIKIIQGPDEYISREENIGLVGKFLESISEDYKNEFYKYIKDNRINFNAQYDCCEGNAYEDNLIINIKEKNNLSDTFILTHEFFHILSSKNYDKRFRHTKDLYNELPPIMAELYLFDFLKNEGYNPSKYTESRLGFLKSNITFLTDITKLYFLAKTDKFDYKNIKDSFNNVNDKYCENLLNFVCNGKYNIDNTIDHSFPLLLALKLKRENESYDKLVSLTNNLWMMDLDDYSKLINIDLSAENAINKHIFKESVDDFLDQSRYSEKKSR